MKEAQIKDFLLKCEIIIFVDRRWHMTHQNTKYILLILIILKIIVPFLSQLLQQALTLWISGINEEFMWA